MAPKLVLPQHKGRAAGSMALAYQVGLGAGKAAMLLWVMPAYMSDVSQSANCLSASASHLPRWLTSLVWRWLLAWHLRCMAVSALTNKAHLYASIWAGVHEQFLIAFLIILSFLSFAT